MRTRCNNKSQGYGQEFMKKITVLVFCMLSIITITYANNNIFTNSTDNIQSQCVITGNVEVRTVESFRAGNEGYTGLRISMNNKNDYMVNITIYLTVDGATASREYQFVLDPKENRIENLDLSNTTKGFKHEVYYKFSVTKCY